MAGEPGGEYPFWVSIKGNSTAYISSLRDREIVVMGLAGRPAVLHRIKIAGNPNKMLLNRDQSRLFVTADNSDTVSIIDTTTNRILETVSTVGPSALASNLKDYTGSAPNSAHTFSRRAYALRDKWRLEFHRHHSARERWSSISGNWAFASRLVSELRQH